MSNILFIATLVLNAAGFLFSVIYLWINVFCKFSDIYDRNASITKIARVSMILSIIFAFLTCLLSRADYVEDAIAQSTLLFLIIAITWLVVLGICGIIMLISVVSKKLFKPNINKIIMVVFKMALPAAIITMVLTWLFS